MVSIINLLLDLSNIEGGKLELERTPFRLRDPFAEARDMAVGIASTKGVTLAVLAKRSGPDDALTLSVSDTGIGIPAAKLGRLFQAYSLADAGVSRRTWGTGLGLALARGIAEAMGGTLTAESDEGRGGERSSSSPPSCRPHRPRPDPSRPRPKAPPQA